MSLKDQVDHYSVVSSTVKVVLEYSFRAFFERAPAVTQTIQCCSCPPPVAVPDFSPLLAVIAFALLVLSGVFKFFFRSVFRCAALFQRLLVLLLLRLFRIRIMQVRALSEADLQGKLGQIAAALKSGGMASAEITWCPVEEGALVDTDVQKWRAIAFSQRDGEIYAVYDALEKPDGTWESFEPQEHVFPLPRDEFAYISVVVRTRRGMGRPKAPARQAHVPRYGPPAPAVDADEDDGDVFAECDSAPVSVPAERPRRLRASPLSPSTWDLPPQPTAKEQRDWVSWLAGWCRFSPMDDGPGAEVRRAAHRMVELWAEVASEIRGDWKQSDATLELGFEAVFGFLVACAPRGFNRDNARRTFFNDVDPAMARFASAGAARPSRVRDRGSRGGHRAASPSSSGPICFVCNEPGHKRGDPACKGPKNGDGGRGRK